jgi:hypothetical protein
VVFESSEKLNLVFKLGNDEESLLFKSCIEDVDKRILTTLASDGVNYPKSLGNIADRYRPLVTPNEFRGEVSFEMRGEIPLSGKVPKDCLLGEMKEDGPVQVDVDYFLQEFRYRPIKAIFEFPYMTVMNTGSKRISVKPLIKQLIMMPEMKKNSIVQDNSSFRFISEMELDMAIEAEQ